MKVIRVIMMLVHTYFNIIRSFINGYKKLKLRFDAKNKVNLLKRVNVEEIPEPDRLCAICYSDFETGAFSIAVIETDCRHRFHAECIQRWLYLKNVCPLCH